MYRYLRYTLILILLASVNTYSQVSVSFNTALYGRSIDGLSYAQVINASAQTVYAKIRITVREMTQGIAATIRVPYFQLKAGSNIINNQNFTRSNIVFANNAVGTQLSLTGKIPEGEFEFCFEVTVGDPKTQAVIDVSEFCFQSSIAPITPLLLIDPIDGDKFCNTRP